MIKLTEYMECIESALKQGIKLEQLNDIFFVANKENNTVAHYTKLARIIRTRDEAIEALKQCENIIGMAQLQGKLSDNALSPVQDALNSARKVLDKVRGE